jgi:hypothetical protein
MPRVIHFEIHAENPERAIKFYQSLFGWDFFRLPGDQDYWLITTGKVDEPGINGGLIPRRGTIDGTAVIAYICTVEVPSLENTLRTLQDLAGQIVVEKFAVPGVGWLAYAKDTEGNIFGISQNDPSAK